MPRRGVNGGGECKSFSTGSDSNAKVVEVLHCLHGRLWIDSREAGDGEFVEGEPVMNKGASLQVRGERGNSNKVGQVRDAATAKVGG